MTSIISYILDKFRLIIWIPIDFFNLREDLFKFLITIFTTVTIFSLTNIFFIKLS